MSKHFFTFGFGQGHDNGFVRIEAPNADLAREEMVRRYGRRWGFQYDEKGFEGQEEKYGLHEVFPRTEEDARLRAFLEGLHAENIDEMMQEVNPDYFRKQGELIFNSIDEAKQTLEMLLQKGE